MKSKTIVIGLGITGYSVVEYLRSKDQSVSVIDTRLSPPKLQDLIQHYPEVDYFLGEFSNIQLEDAECIVVSPGISLKHSALLKAKEDGVLIKGDIQLFFENVKKPVVGITGTNAKSTVTTLVGLMLQDAGKNVAIGGNLGIPALDLLRTNPDADYFVLELSSFQLEAIQNISLEVACILNITPDHLDRYDSFQDYCQAKWRIYSGAKYRVANLDDFNTWSVLTEAQARETTYFSFSPTKSAEFGIADHLGRRYLVKGLQVLIDASELFLIGKHDQGNALAAIAIGTCLKIPLESMLQTLRKFKGLPHRCAWVRELNGVRWYNDSKGTNVGATQAAIEGLGSAIFGKVIVILGGISKQADFSPLIPFLKQYVSCAILIGEAALDLEKICESNVDYVHANSMQDAVEKAYQKAKLGDVVLLSPACASFDMFKDYIHRGEVFTQAVHEIRA